jgi:hypothetical protein
VTSSDIWFSCPYVSESLSVWVFTHTWKKSLSRAFETIRNGYVQRGGVVGWDSFVSAFCLKHFRRTRITFVTTPNPHKLHSVLGRISSFCCRIWMWFLMFNNSPLILPSDQERNEEQRRVKLSTFASSWLSFANFDLFKIIG